VGQAPHPARTHPLRSAPASMFAVLASRHASCGAVSATRDRRPAWPQGGPMIRRSFGWGVLFLSLSLAGVAHARGTTRLCHVSPGAQPQTIEVAPADVQMHLAHGDAVGNCTDPAVCSAVCDDHNACTVNDGVSSKGGCTCQPQAVTCTQDQNFCTAEV